LSQLSREKALNDMATAPLFRKIGAIQETLIKNGKPFCEY